MVDGPIMLWQSGLEFQIWDTARHVLGLSTIKIVSSCFGRQHVVVERSKEGVRGLLVLLSKQELHLVLQGIWYMECIVHCALTSTQKAYHDVGYIELPRMCLVVPRCCCTRPRHVRGTWPNGRHCPSLPCWLGGV